MNKLYLQKIVNGRYGRRISYENVEKVTPDNVVMIVANHIGEFNTNKQVIKYLWDYKNGDQPILYRDKKKAARDDIVNTIMENRAYEIVQFNVAQTYGEEIQYVSNSKDDAINEAVERLNKFMHNAFKYQRNVTQGEWKSAVGTSFLAVQRTDSKGRPFRLTVPTPMNTFCIYSSITGEQILSVQELKDIDDNQTYYLCFSDNMEFSIKNGRLVYSKLHAFGGNPIVEIPNNQDRLSDIEIVITLLDAINTMQSNRVDGVEQFVQSWIKFVNCEVDREEFEKMKMSGALVVKSNNGDNKADVDVLTTELNQTETQVLKDDLWESALSVLAIPSKQNGSDGGSTMGAVQLRAGWDFSKNRAKLKDAYVIEAESKLADVVLNVLRVSGNDLGITSMDFDVNIPHSPQDNLIVKCQALEYLLTNGVHPLIAVKTCGLWSDSEKVYLMSKPYFDVLYQRIDEKIEELALQDEEPKAQDLLEKFNNQQKQATTE